MTAIAMPRPMVDSPSRNDGVTIAGAVCPTCGHGFRPVGRRQFCSDACRQAAWRRRHHAPVPAVSAIPPRVAPGSTVAIAVVYECPVCGARLLGEQRCPDCNVFCRRVGPGGRCPACDEPVAVVDLITPEGR